MERPILVSNKSRAGLGLVAAFFCAACLSGVSMGVTAATQTKPNCTTENQMTACVCGTSGSVHVERGNSSETATLSESTNVITVKCAESGFEFVPSDVNLVCVAKNQADLLAACEKGNNSVSPIKGFLIDVSDSNLPEWTAPSDEKKGHSLTFPKGNFPLSDRSFFAGCLKKNQEPLTNDECVVEVRVKARTSAVKDSVLTCAYGKESNSSIPEVTLNSENNSLTILCGSEGVMQPNKDSLTAYYCAGSNTNDCREVNLTEIMPTFTSSWWATDEQNSRAPKLVIPEDGFPSQEETIVLGCNKKGNTEEAEDEQDGVSTAATLPTCRVKVTLSAQTSGSQAPNVSFIGWFVSALILRFLDAY
ncbi:srs domain-containing protein [Neospora caninum Liverpool]|uniref:Srs domain-containing protein n=1 Tax=Neospora caninum (strain Liverpool) TaxID=572307 RepID=F0VCG1_NEOCL|nr:srs domain-containing protein [Neospora caninum Liverpool]CBZ51283.1 srs domain-containing protein [Neospora caninum Liverpool]CEL68598.1 TPA: SRS domain-containing protein [Neospora caninum Liverpool]|eukprot:XP_003881316.1 srs domain-containing protein [Neospora caninum Liverpool]